MMMLEDVRFLFLVVGDSNVLFDVLRGLALVFFLPTESNAILLFFFFF